MAQTTFNRELGAAPAGITRFGQIRTEDGSNVTVNSYRTFAGDGSFPLSDVYKVTYGSTGLVTYNLDAEAFAVSGITVIGADGSGTGRCHDGDVWSERCQRGGPEYRSLGIRHRVLQWRAALPSNHLGIRSFLCLGINT